jgi:hypothetical protein
MLESFLEALFRHMDWWRLINNIIVGVVSSGATWLFISISRRLSDRRKFSGYSGLYETYTIDDERIAGELVEIKWLRNNMLHVRNKSDAGLWESYISMNSDLPHVGAGYFRYLDRSNAWGSHEIHSDMGKREILVFSSGSNLLTVEADERGAGVRKTTAYKWKRAATEHRSKP